mmetsp:Transcript_24668/g.80693  ORF Transcript_24668/g.80693 Transcript_24668/m.80693 type:complete len:237 (+) Transcript_24668:119-829(+)
MHMHMRGATQGPEKTRNRQKKCERQRGAARRPTIPPRPTDVARLETWSGLAPQATCFALSYTTVSDPFDEKRPPLLVSSAATLSWRSTAPLPEEEEAPPPRRALLPRALSGDLVRPPARAPPEARRRSARAWCATRAFLKKESLREVAGVRAGDDSLALLGMPQLDHILELILQVAASVLTMDSSVALARPFSRSSLRAWSRPTLVTATAAKAEKMRTAASGSSQTPVPVTVACGM